MLKDYAETDGMGGDPANLKKPCILVARYAFMYHNVAQDAVWKRSVINPQRVEWVIRSHSVRVDSEIQRHVSIAHSGYTYRM